MKKRLLCITPDFNRSGAPIALMGLLRILLKVNSFNISIMAYGKGELLNSYITLLGEDHIEILKGLNPTPEFRYRLQHEYDIIFLNTAATVTFSYYFQNIDIPVYWWIHEAPSLIKDSFSAFPNPHLLSPNFKLFASSEGAATLFSKDFSYNISVLPVPVFEPRILLQDIPFDIPDDRILFIIPAAYTYIKGQDILLDAIKSLPYEYRQKSFFIFCGYTLDKQIEYKASIFDTASTIDNVLMLDELSQETLYAIMNKCHCVVAPSRIDTIPLTIVEGMMFHKLCLVSSQTGISAYIKDCVNGFIFRDQDELIKRLLLIISDYTSIIGIAVKGYETYNRYFSPSAISNEILDLFSPL